MTLDEAIKHCEEIACDSEQCRLEHLQLAQWLKELKVYRKIELERLQIAGLNDDEIELLCKDNCSKCNYYRQTYWEYWCKLDLI